MDPIRAARDVHEVVLATGRGEVPPDRLLGALVSLRSLREQLTGWEPELIAAARSEGVSWAALAPALGVASRQAAERRFLRLRPSATGETTGEARVDAERDRRAGDRAVADWARRNSAVLRQLAGQVNALEDLDGAARADADRLGAALGGDDVTSLLPPLAAVRGHLGRDHAGLADRLGAIEDHADMVRRDATGHRRDRAT
ncbi:HSP18 transcriptional regulator [Amycolatopsis sp. NBC_01307]|uniref:HSP18 transcriptional regulator n=1 Tax=Amycolatopsis sp. NBC_01307 TaxID=2903561 RepID=UPI002E1539ED|nr:HSP18 transcriptional regulator [Amycolatopsis sp. NBC_01307]